MTSANTAAESEIFFHDRMVDRLFLWMIPYWIKPNHITGLRLLLTPLVVLINFNGNYRVGVPLFLAVAFTDVIDGSLARTRKQITDLGKLIDPLADKLLIGSMVVLLVFRYLPHWIGWAVIGVELVFIALATIWRLMGKVGQANIWGKIKMILQVLAVFLILLALTYEVPVLLTAAAWLFGAAITFALVSLFFHGI